MTQITLVSLTRGEAIVEYEGEEFNVNGEGYTNGTWEIFPKMVYRPTDDGQWTLIDDENLREKIVLALREYWDGT